MRVRRACVLRACVSVVVGGGGGGGVEGSVVVRSCN